MRTNTYQKQLHNYNIFWDTQSENSGESMPLGGKDIGCNVWVENNEILIYMAQSGAFDENGNMLKSGRLRLSFDKNIFENHFRVALRDCRGIKVWILPLAKSRTYTK